jgi:hypothetical protein
MKRTEVLQEVRKMRFEEAYLIFLEYLLIGLASAAFGERIFNCEGHNLHKVRALPPSILWIISRDTPAAFW